MKKTLLFSLFIIWNISGHAGVGGTIGGSGNGGGGGTKEITFPWGHRLVTLEDYDKSMSYNVHWPKINFGNISTTINKVCSEGESFKTIAPIEVCTKAVVVQVCDKVGSKGTSEECRNVGKGEKVIEKYGRRLEWGCAETAKKDFETSKFYQSPICLKWEQSESDTHSVKRWICVAQGFETKEYPENYSVNVTSTQYTKNTLDQPEINIDFDIPACK